MTENEVRQKLSESFDEMNPIIVKMTNLIMDAYEKGFEVGMKVGQGLVK